MFTKKGYWKKGIYIVSKIEIRKITSQDQEYSRFYFFSFSATRTCDETADGRRERKQLIVRTAHLLCVSVPTEPGERDLPGTCS